MKTFRACLLLTWVTLAMAGSFIFCQVSGVMCAVPDLAMAGQGTIMPQKEMACLMDGTILCPQPAISSPERQVKKSLTGEVDHAPILLGSASVLTVPLVPTLRPWSSAPSIVPISISASPVLRI